MNKPVISALCLLVLYIDGAESISCYGCTTRHDKIACSTRGLPLAERYFLIPNCTVCGFRSGFPEIDGPRVIDRACFKSAFECNFYFKDPAELQGWSSSCCTSDRCNNQDLPNEDVDTSNTDGAESISCYVCNTALDHACSSSELTDSQLSTNLNCNACGTKLGVGSCVGSISRACYSSLSACNRAKSFSDSAGLNVSVSCCTSDKCNNQDSMTTNPDGDTLNEDGDASNYNGTTFNEDGATSTKPLGAALLLSIATFIAARFM